MVILKKEVKQTKEKIKEKVAILKELNLLSNTSSV